MWNVRGWKSLTVHDEPPRVALKQEFLSWLKEVPEPCQTVWGQRLKSDLDHPHHSVRLELYLHNFFRSNNWNIEIEPEMPGNPNKPDFRVTLGKDTILVEAKAVLDEQSAAQQAQRLTQLADNLTSKLSRDVIIEPLSDLPPSLPAKKIKAQIEQRARTQANEVVRFDFSDVHLKTQYTLRIVILPRGSGSTEPGGVGGTISDVGPLATSERVRDALEQKAGKYGSIEVPFLIAVYGAVFPVRTRDERGALLGDFVWNLHSSGPITETQKPNGFFTSVRQGKRRHEDVSAVLFYRLKWLENTHVHSVHIYHNPFALRPLNPALFPGVPQMVLLGDGRTLKWINGEPE